MTYYLCIDTSDRAVVGLCRGEGDLQAPESLVELAREESADSRHHAEDLTPTIERMCAQAGIVRPDALVVGRGPGAFTGLRAGLVTARILAHVWSIPAWGVSSLEPIARAATEAGRERVLAAIDARRREVFVLEASCENGHFSVAGAPEILTPAALAARAEQGACIALARAGLYAEQLPSAEVYPLSPLHMVRAALAEGADVSVEPEYVRRPDIHGQAG